MNETMRPGFTEDDTVTARALDRNSTHPVPYRPEQLFSDWGA